MIFKTTLLKTNPQIIRVFEMKAEQTLKDLLAVVCCVHGWRQDTTLYIYKGPAEMLESELICNHFSENTDPSLWKIKTNSDLTPKPVFTAVSGGSNNWVFRLEVISAEENTDINIGLPRLIRFRGLNPIQDTANVENWNIIAQELQRSGRYYDYRKGFISASDYEPNLSMINKQLCNKVAKGLEDITIDWSNARLFAVMADSHSLEKVKNIIRDNNLQINYNRRKSLVVDELIRYFENDAVWETILNKMTMDEYEAFKTYATGGEVYGGSVFKVLTSYGVLVSNNIGYRMPIARELLVYYEKMMKTKGDAEMVLHKKAEEVLECAGKLYGFFTKSVAFQLGQVMYPDDFTMDLLKEHWHGNSKFRILRESVPYRRRELEALKDSDMMYDLHDFTSDDVIDYLKVMSQVEVEYFIPEKEVAFRYARKDMTFTAKEAETLLRALNPLKKRYSYMPEQTMLKDIYRMCHLNYRVSDVVERMKRNYYLTGKDAEFRTFAQAIVECKKNIRQIMLFGYTPIEAKKLWHIELQEG